MVDAAQKLSGRQIIDLVKRGATADQISARLGIPVDCFTAAISTASNLPVPVQTSPRGSARQRAISKALEGVA